MTANLDRSRPAGLQTAGIVGVVAFTVALTWAATVSADSGDTVDLNGWTLQLNTGNPPFATLLDPTKSLVGADATEISGTLHSNPIDGHPIDGHEVYSEAFIGYYNGLYIDDSWNRGLFGGPPTELVDVFDDDSHIANGQEHGGPMVFYGLMVPTLDGREVVDLLNYGASGATHPPLINPDAVGPVDVGGLPLASPDAGALLNDLYGAITQGDSADWNNAITLIGDLLGLDPIPFT